MVKNLLRTFLKGNFWLINLLVWGTVSWSLTMVKSGWVYSFGMGFWGPNGRDGVWHIALAESLAKGSWEMPVFAGEAIKNYHIGFDLVLAFLSKGLGISTVDLYFRIIPVVLAFLAGFLTYKLVLLWTGSRKSALGSTFFVYFGGSFGWLVSLIKSHGFDGESMFWSQQSASTLINPPFALSFVFLLLGLIFLAKYRQARRFRYSVLAVIFFAAVVSIKVYAVLGLAALLVAGIYEILLNKKFDLILIFMVSAVLALLLFYPLNKSSAGLIVFQPFWFLETMMAISDRLFWPRFHSAMTTYRFGNIWFKAIPAYVVAFGIFILGNLGTRTIFLKDILKKMDYLKVFMLSVILAGVTIPTLFIQAGTPWNTIQFIYYSLMFSGIMAGITAADLLVRHQKSIAILGLVVLTLPTTLATLGYHYLPGRPPAKISREELQAMAFLVKQPKGTVLTYPFDPIKAAEAVKNPPRPLYLYDETSYVAAFSKQPVFEADNINLDITQYDWRGRRKKIMEFLNQPDQEKARSFLKENKIKYIYWIKPQRAFLGETQLGLTKIFENKEVDIYVVKSEI